MQYGMEVNTYKRKGTENYAPKSIKSDVYLSIIIYCIFGFFISRVMLTNHRAPFGIAFIIAVLMNRDRKTPMLIGLGSFIGYISIYSNVANLTGNLIFVVLLVFTNYFIYKMSKKSKIIIYMAAIICGDILISYLLESCTLLSSVLFSLGDSICILVLYYIMNYALLCYKEIKTKYVYNNEEIISMVILSALVIAGTWGIAPLGISLRNISGLCFVGICAYITGTSIGSAAGVAVGMMIGITSDNVTLYIAIYGFCGLTMGVFRDTGKWISSAAFAVAFFIIKLYGNIGGTFKGEEVIIAIGILLCIGDKQYSKLSLIFDWETKNDEINKDYIENVKSIFVERLKNFSYVLYGMSNTVKNLVNNDRLLMKSKSGAMIDNLADSVCANCSMNSLCWKREIHYTYCAFGELIENYQNNNGKFPDELERKCVKKNMLIKNAEEIVDNYVLNEMWHNRLIEGRKIISGHINNMADIVDELVQDFNTSLSFNRESEKRIKKLLDAKGISFSEVFCYSNKSGKLNIKISVKDEEKNKACTDEILPIVNEAVGINMSPLDDKFNSKTSTKLYTIEFEEKPKYSISSYVRRKCKDGESYNGDSYSYGKLRDGNYMVMISDGMGSGSEAGKESKAAVELIEKFTEAGFSKDTAVNTVNSIMSMKFSEEEKFSTLDICSIDLYNGEMNIMKVGAVSTYIKRKNFVETIKSRSLPIGILDKVDVDVVDKKLSSGDIVVMLSDGLLELVDKNFNMDEWIRIYLENSRELNPKIIADDIISKALSVNKNRAKDDMTIIVSKIYESVGA
ncbi:stage II sporulation protein E [Clostridium oryzae]|uniref:Stage II sporulation protein E n=1 Tax=Clostridium oryzae TaxID=1450648 RepID=A0A1V4IMH4_9CLOT|nr:stage II sporulation protein E [Clostridium oryzae]OPJ61069.1 stage II sporulation protein E [Clostridium oryzae]